MDLVFRILSASLEIFREAAFYILLGFLAAGIVRAYVRPQTVVQYLNKGRFSSVFYASLIGVPIPLCSCGVVPAVAGIKKQGANNGACLAFLISTPESGVDSIALTYSLLDPVLTVLRPVSAFLTAMTAGLIQNFTGPRDDHAAAIQPDLSCPIDNCCSGIDCDPRDHARHHTFGEKLAAGMRFAFHDLMSDLAVWFILGILLAGMISALVPDSWFSEHTGSGLMVYLGMMAVSLPMYVCATMSTPIAAALILKGLSPGAALVFLLAGPASNITTMSMILGVLGKRAFLVYLLSIITCTLGLAFFTDHIYYLFQLPPPTTGFSDRGELIPSSVEIAAAVVLALMIVRVYWKKAADRLARRNSDGAPSTCDSTQRCGCSEAPGGT